MTRFRILVIFFLLITPFFVHSQINIPYVEDFSEMYDSLYNQPTDDIVGVDFLSFNGVWPLGYVQEYQGYTDLLGIESSSYDKDSLIFKLDLSNYDTTSADLLVTFDMFNGISSEEEWKILVRQNSSKDYINAGTFQLEPLREMMTLISSKLTPLLKENDQNYGPDFEIVFTRKQGNGTNSSSYEYYLDKFQVSFVPEYDIELARITVPDLKVHLGATEKIELQLANKGSKTITSLPVKYIIENENGDSLIYNEGVTINLEPDSIKTVTSSLDFDLSEYNVYKITAITQLPDDPVSSNNTVNGFTLRPDVYTEGLPFRQSFDIGSSTYQYHHYTQSLYGVTGFTYKSENPSGYMNLRDYLNLNNWFNDPAEHAIFITLDLSDYSVDTHDLVLDFLYSYSYVYGSDLEENKIYARGSEENEWIDIFDWQDGSQLHKDWTHAKYIPISTILSENDQEFSTTFQVKVAIYSTRGSLNVDDFFLRERPDHDLDVFSLSPVPEGGLDISPTDTFTVALINFGALAENDVEVHLKLDGPDGVSVIPKTISGAFNSLDTMYVGFKEPFDFSTPGNYRVTAYTSVSGDVDQANDSISFNTHKISRLEVSLPFHQDFENVPVKSYSLEAGNIDGAEGFSYNRNSTYPVTIIDNFGFRTGTNSIEVGKDNELILSLDMFHYDTTYFDIYMDFAYAVDIISYDHLLPVMIRGDLDDEWVELTSFTYPLTENGDEESSIPTYWNRKVKMDITGTLKAAKQNFTPYTQIKFHGPSDGWKVIYDDITIYSKNLVNLELWDMKLPESFIDETDENSVLLRLINRGENDVTNFNITLDMVKNEGDTSHHNIEVTDVSLSPDDTLLYEIANPFDVSEDGKYEYIASISVPEDYYAFDDILKRKVYNRSVISEFPYVFDFEKISRDERLNVFGEFQNLPGLYIDSENDILSLAHESFSHQYIDSTVASTLAVNYAMRYGGEQSLTWTFDLEGQSTEDSVLLDIFYYLSYFYASYGENDALYVRGSTDNSWVKIKIHQTNFTRSSYIKNKYLINKTLSDNDQEFSSRTQVKIVCTSGYYAADFHLISFELHRKKTELVTGLDDDLSISLYPNPTNDILNVETKFRSDLQVLNLSGKTLMFTEISKGKNQINLSSFQSGIYIINIMSEDGSFNSEKIIVR